MIHCVMILVGAWMEMTMRATQSVAPCEKCAINPYPCHETPWCSPSSSMQKSFPPPAIEAVSGEFQPRERPHAHHHNPRNHSKTIVAPTSSNAFLISSASSFGTSFLITVGAPSTASFAALMDRDLSILRNSLMILIFCLSSNLSSFTLNSVFSTFGSSGAGAAASAAPAPAAAIPPAGICICIIWAMLNPPLDPIDTKGFNPDFKSACIGSGVSSGNCNCDSMYLHNCMDSIIESDKMLSPNF
mmetsp:Transcript_8697/g.32099  ORF Transcript_8697/g.32099 Transcript_8697/m.32099 type:complete len:244 (+) Transcript_8697:108-839(+)